MADAFNLGRHEAMLETLSTDVSEMKGDIAWIKDTLAEKRGERRVATAVWAAGSGALGALSVFLTKAWLAGHSHP